MGSDPRQKLPIARLPGCGPPSQPQKVIKRGNNRSPIFFAPADFEFFTETALAGDEEFLRFAQDDRPSYARINRCNLLGVPALSHL